MPVAYHTQNTSISEYILYEISHLTYIQFIFYLYINLLYLVFL